MARFVFDSARRVQALLFAALAIVATSATAAAQATYGIGVQTADPPRITQLPDDLTPETVDGLLARLTDSEIRELLRDELARRAEERRAAEAEAADVSAEIRARLARMAEQIETRATRWANAIANISQRSDRVRARLDKARHGPGAMLLAGLAVLAAGVAAARATVSLTASWRRWLANPDEPGYWGRVFRSFALGIVEILPIIAFVAATRLGFMAFGPSEDGRGILGPLSDYEWIFETGVFHSWAFIVIVRRAFAPDAPAIRITPLDDDLTGRLYRLLKTAVRIGAAGWLIGGLILHLGLGFPPVMVLRALTGTLVAAVMLAGLWRNRARIRDATARAFAEATGAFAGTAIAAAPTCLALYIIAAWGYWLAHWLETGQDRLAGPAGTLIVYLALPILDRMGRELVASGIRTQTPLAGRFRKVFYGAWRLLLALFAILVVARLWGIDLVDLALGPEAPTWASTACDILVTLLLGYLIWNLIRAALYTEKRISDAAEDFDPSSVASASRLDTLVPLFRNTLLGFLATAIIMIVLSAIGVDIAPLIASAGIVGIAVGFGAQSLVRDVFSGIFFLIDDAFRVGEYIELDTDMRGEVESISVRSLQLRHHRGPVITIPFGELKQITNHNRDWVIYKMSFRMEPQTDPQKFKKLVKGVGQEFFEHPDHGPKFIEPLKSQGVYYVDDDSALVMRVKFKCKPRAQFVLRREIYHRLRHVFAENGLHLARRKVEVVGAEGEDDLIERAASAEETPAPPMPGMA